MIVTQRRAIAIRRLALIGLLGVSGCDEDKRLAQYAQRSVEQQAKQNEHIARQSETVAKQSQELAEAAHRMVEADAKSRQELVQAQRELNGELQQERGSLDRQREDLEQERRRIADSRHREPMIAAAVNATALMLACLLPLVVCAYALRQLTRSQPDDDGLSELLVQELTAEEPLLLPGWTAPRPALEQQVTAFEPSNELGGASQTGDIP